MRLQQQLSLLPRLLPSLITFPYTTVSYIFGPSSHLQRSLLLMQATRLRAVKPRDELRSISSSFFSPDFLFLFIELVFLFLLPMSQLYRPGLKPIVLGCMISCCLVVCSSVCCRQDQETRGLRSNPPPSKCHMLLCRQRHGLYGQAHLTQSWNLTYFSSIKRNDDDKRQSS